MTVSYRVVHGLFWIDFGLDLEPTHRWPPRTIVESESVLVLVDIGRIRCMFLVLKEKNKPKDK